MTNVSVTFAQDYTLGATAYHAGDVASLALDVARPLLNSRIVAWTPHPDTRWPVTPGGDLTPIFLSKPPSAPTALGQTLGYDPAVSSNNDKQRWFTSQEHVARALGWTIVTDTRWAGGAKIDGTTDDSAAVAAAAAAANAAGGGTVWFPPGTCVAANIPIYPNVHYRGVGRNATIIQAPASATAPVMVTDQFASLTGSGSAAGSSNFSIRDLTIEGNRDGGATSAGIRIYGSTYLIESVTVRNCNGYGIYSEWKSGGGGGVNGDGLEATVTHVKVKTCGNPTTPGVYLAGPHDSQWSDCIVWSHGTGITKPAGIQIAPSTSDGTQFFQTHVWGSDHQWAIINDGYATSINDCQIEGASVGQVWFRGNNQRLIGGRIFAVLANGSEGIRIGDATGAAVNSAFIVTQLSSCTGGSINFANDAGNSYVQALAYQATGTIIVGTPNAATVYSIATGGQSSGGLHSPIKSSGVAQFAGPARLSAGTDAAPAFGPTADPTTGLRWDSSGVFRLSFAGALGYTFDATRINRPASTDLIFGATGDTARVSFSRSLFIADGKDIAVGTTTGTKIGTGNTQKFGMYGKAPVAQQTVSGDRNDGSALTALLATLSTFGIVVDASTVATTASWAASTAYVAGQRVVLPTGGIGMSLTARTSRASFDATERAAWSFIPGGHYELLSSGTSWTVPFGISQLRARLVGGGGGGGGGGSAALTSGVATQVGGGAGGAGLSEVLQVVGLTGGTTGSYLIGAGQTGGGGGAASTGATGNVGSDGTTGSQTTLTLGGTTYSAGGGGGGKGSLANSTASAGGGIYARTGSTTNAGLPGAGGVASSTGSGVGPPIDMVAGGSAGVPATSTLGGNGGNARTVPTGNVGSASGNTATANGANGAAATIAGCGGGGGGAGAPGGAGGNGGSGGNGQIELWY